MRRRGVFASLRRALTPPRSPSHEALRSDLPARKPSSPLVKPVVFQSDVPTRGPSRLTFQLPVAVIQLFHPKAKQLDPCAKRLSDLRSSKFENSLLHTQILV